MTFRVFFIISLLICGASSQASLQIHIADASGKAIDLPGAVIWATPKDKSLLQGVVAPANMEQFNRQFKPFILAVQRNAAVSFPNHDRTAHHVYSFSKPITFELPLYKKATPKPVVFSKAGLVPLGCNIHDWMIGYIMVVDTPFFTQYDGGASIKSMPPGEYDIELWHPAIAAGEELKHSMVFSGQAKVQFTLSKPVRKVVQPKAPELAVDEDEDY